MTGERKPLPLGSLDDFAPKPRERAAEATNVVRDVIDQVSEFPSRERSDEGQLNIRTSKENVRRFKAMAKSERYTQGAFLQILMEAYQNR